MYVEPPRLPGHIFQGSDSISSPLSFISAPCTYFASANSAVKDLILIVNDSGFGSAMALFWILSVVREYIFYLSTLL